MQSFLYYWKPETVDCEMGALLRHSASEQFGRVSRGDHIWHVTVRDGELVVVGRVIVGHLVNEARAAQLLGTNDLWEASHHVVAATGTAEPVREVKIRDLAKSLRFQSKRDRLRVLGGHVDAQQLRTMRTLTPRAADELERSFRAATSVASAAS